MILAILVLAAAFCVVLPLSRKSAAKRTRRQLALAVAAADYMKAIEPANQRFMHHAEFFAMQANLAEERLQVALREFALTSEFPEQYTKAGVARLARALERAQAERDSARALYESERAQALEQFFTEAKPFLDALPGRFEEVQRLTTASAWYYEAIENSGGIPILLPPMR